MIETWVRSVSWRSVVAGVVTSVAVAIVMSVLGVALGFTVIEPQSSTPFSGLGIAFGIWSFLSVVISLAAGGFMGGFFSATRGLEHGFLVWATTLIVATIFGGMAIGSAVRTVGTVAQGLGQGAASVVSTAAEGIAGVAGDVADRIQEEVDLNVSQDGMTSDIRGILRDTGVPTLQPEFLRGQLREARSDLRNTLNRIRRSPEDNGQIIDEFISKQEARLNNITADVDRNTAVNTLMRNRNMSRMEAEDTVDNAIMVYNETVVAAQDALEDARLQIQDARQHLEESVRQAREAADEMASAAAGSALLAGLALILGAILTSVAGMIGMRCAVRRMEVDVTVI